jgi:TPR repeat protein
VAQDYEMAFKYYKLSADQGGSSFSVMLALLLLLLLLL